MLMGEIIINYHHGTVQQSVADIIYSLLTMAWQHINLNGKNND